MLQKLNEIAQIASPQSITNASTNGEAARSIKPNAFTLPWHELRYQHTAAIRALLQEKYKPATANTALSALRQVLKAAWRLGQMSAEEYQRAADQPVIKGKTLLRGRALAGGELAALINACYEDDSPIGFRDAALVAVLYAGGLRRSEIAKLDLESYDEETGALTILGGKGGKDRICYMGTGSDALEDWLKIRGKAAGPLFYPIRRGGHIERHRMTEQSVLYILQKRGKEAGVKAFSPHDMRRTFVTYSMLGLILPRSRSWLGMPMYKPRPAMTGGVKSPSARRPVSCTSLIITCVSFISCRLSVKNNALLKIQFNNSS